MFQAISLTTRSHFYDNNIKWGAHKALRYTASMLTNSSGSAGCRALWKPNNTWPEKFFQLILFLWIFVHGWNWMLFLCVLCRYQLSHYSSYLSKSLPPVLCITLSNRDWKTFKLFIWSVSRGSVTFNFFSFWPIIWRSFHSFVMKTPNFFIHIS